MERLWASLESWDRWLSFEANKIRRELEKRFHKSYMVGRTKIRKECWPIGWPLWSLRALERGGVRLLVNRM